MVRLRLRRDSRSQSSGASSCCCARVSDLPALTSALDGVPIRVIDAWFPPDVVVEHNEKYPDFAFAQVKGTGHWLILERPGEVNKLIRKFVNDFVSNS